MALFECKKHLYPVEKTWTLCFGCSHQASWLAKPATYLNFSRKNRLVDQHFFIVNSRLQCSLVDPDFFFPFEEHRGRWCKRLISDHIIGCLWYILQSLDHLLQLDLDLVDLVRNHVMMTHHYLSHWISHLLFSGSFLFCPSFQTLPHSVDPHAGYKCVHVCVWKIESVFGRVNRRDFF